MKKVFIVEEDFQTREKIEAMLNKKGFDSQPCISLDNFLIKKKKEQKNVDHCIVITHSDNVLLIKDLDSTVSLSDVYTYDSSNFDESLKSIEARLDFLQNSKRFTHFNYILIGSSTGGFPIVKEIINKINPKETIVLINQHISKSHSEQMHETLDNTPSSTPINIIKKETELMPGQIYMLTGGIDFKIVSGIEMRKIIPGDDSENGYHPSFNLLLENAESLDGPVGIIVLSGLGNDGRNAIERLSLKKCEVVVQDPQTAVAPGMPSEAIATKKVNKILPPEELVQYIKEMAV